MPLPSSFSTLQCELVSLEGANFCQLKVGHISWQVCACSVRNKSHSKERKRRVWCLWPLSMNFLYKLEKKMTEIITGQKHILHFLLQAERRQLFLDSLNSSLSQANGAATIWFGAEQDQGEASLLVHPSPKVHRSLGTELPKAYAPPLPFPLHFLPQSSSSHTHLQETLFLIDLFTSKLCPRRSRDSNRPGGRT